METTEPRYHRIPVIVGLVLALAGSYLFYPLFLALDQVVPVFSRPVLRIVVPVTQTVAVLLLIVFWERRPLRSINLLRMQREDVWWALGAWIVGLATFGITTPLAEALGLSTTKIGLGHLAAYPLWFRALIALKAGITEEILYRGYPIERLQEWTGRLDLSVGATFVVFVALHLPFWGLGGTLQIGVWTIVAIGLYIKRRNVPACMLMHTLNDAVAFLFLPVVLPDG